MIGIVVVIFLLGTGGNFNPIVWPEQFDRRIHPQKLITIDQDSLNELNMEYAFFKKNLENGAIEPCFNTKNSVIRDIYCFITNKIAYKSDISNFFGFDYLATPKEVIDRGADDCDGKAVLLCTLLVEREYNAYVVMGMEHTWVEIERENYTVYISYINTSSQIIVTTEPLNSNKWYVKFNAEEPIWNLWPLMTQAINIFIFSLIIALLSQYIFIKRWYTKPVRYVSEMVGYFRYIIFIFLVIFCVWALMLIFIKLLAKVP
ncbi:MAG: hypothetical protein ACXQTP_05175 [Candidatus Methanofastidiosia archaeon]